MKKVIERIVKSSGSPDTNDMWLDDNLNLKVYDNEEWKTISGGEGSGGGEGGGCDCKPVEANPTIEDGDVTTPLEALKVGNNIYSVPLSPMVVEGTIDWGASPVKFTPGEGAPTFAEARNQMLQGGVIYIMAYDDAKNIVISASFSDASSIGAFVPGEDAIVWEANQTIQINGTLSEDLLTFTPDDDEMSWADAKQAFDDGDHILLRDSNKELTLSVSYYDSEANALITEPFNGVAYSWYAPVVPDN